MTRFFYRNLLRLMLPAVGLHAVAMAVREKSLRYLLQRFGLRLPTLPAQPLWMHCASVGELNTALTLAAAWREAHPGDDILLTSATVAAHRLFRRKAGAGIRHCYLPLDYPLLCRRFIKKIKPRCALIVEAEIWLNLFSECGAHGIPVIIVNGRLSDRTLKPARRFGGYHRQSLAHVRAVFARSEDDRKNFVALGMTPDKTETLGNLKYSMKMPPELPNHIRRPYCLAASTHDGEEVQIARAWRRADTGGLVLVIAPRHPHRCSALARQLRRNGFDSAIHDADTGGGADASMVLFCEVGRLPALIRHAKFVFLGGSLVRQGGHNLLEAARLGTPQASGPYLDNFAQEARALRQAGGLLIANNVSELAAIFTRAAAGAYREQADNAAAFMHRHADVAAHYVKRLQALDF